MLKARIIPCLLLHEGGLVKTTRFRKPKYIGDPINAVRIYNDKEVDELIFLDIDASKNGTGPDLSVIRDLCTECFMPFAYGGGVHSIDQIQAILTAGVEKVCINHGALNNLNLISEAAKHFGSSTIIGAVDLKKDFWGTYQVYDHVSGKTLKKDPVAYIQELANAGAGEIFINNVDRDGTYAGIDVDLTRELNKIVNTPLISCGGASSITDVTNAIRETGVSAVAAGSIFVYNGPHRAVLISYPKRETLTELLT